VAEITAVCISQKKGQKKKNVGKGILVENHGLEGDAHAGEWHRQVSLLAEESIRKMKEKGLEVGPGDFAENITTRGIELTELPIGTKLKLGGALVEVTQIGKECHDRCAIYHRVGDCVMPREGIFVRVLKGGPVSIGDKIEVIEDV
jgi:MOSC domain-containing protein YiiM